MSILIKLVDKLTDLGERVTPYRGKKYHFSAGGKVVCRGVATDLEKREAQLKEKWPSGRIVPLGETYIRFNPNTVTILESWNISSIIDNGILDFTICFASAFPNTDYVFQIGSNGNLVTKVLEQSVGSIRIKFDEPCPDFVDINFY